MTFALVTEGSPRRSGLRLSAEERRGQVVAAAVTEFARGGYAGTSTEAIAQRAGISQPYLFRLFQTKKELFLAAIGSGFDAIVALFDAAAGELEGQEALHAIGLSYVGYLVNTDLLLLQLHAYAASGDPEIRAYVAGRFAGLVSWLSERVGGLTPEELREFLGMGMLCNVVSALDLTSLKPLWDGVDELHQPKK